MGNQNCSSLEELLQDFSRKHSMIVRHTLSKNEAMQYRQTGQNGTPTTATTTTMPSLSPFSRPSSGQLYSPSLFPRKTEHPRQENSNSKNHTKTKSQTKTRAENQKASTTPNPMSVIAPPIPEDATGVSSRQRALLPNSPTQPLERAVPGAVGNVQAPSAPSPSPSSSASPGASSVFSGGDSTTPRQPVQRYTLMRNQGAGVVMHRNAALGLRGTPGFLAGDGPTHKSTQPPLKQSCNRNQQLIAYNYRLLLSLMTLPCDMNHLPCLERSRTL
jgi:hypothetical protein